MDKSELIMVAVLLFTVLLRFAVVLAVAYMLVPRGALCPRCQVDMAPIRNAFLDRFLPMLQRRWCLECGWSGVTRRVRPVLATRRPVRPEITRR